MSAHQNLTIEAKEDLMEEKNERTDANIRESSIADEAQRPSDEAETTAAQVEDAVDETTESAEEQIIATLTAELAEARRQADEALDRALRAQAELQNFRRRKERETEERVAHANARILGEILLVIDDFERAFDNVPDDLQGEEAAWVEGFRLILRKLQALLEREGVTAIDASGEFDPNLHEAVSLEPSDEVESGNIIGEVRRGYLLRDRVLRPSAVRVAQ
ncbi:MAG: nucleotide exchange factor GrpE [Chloroflexi bacterium]|nr:nucleotide exchange factor GrpE [Chloroflexota bacterium]